MHGYVLFNYFHQTILSISNTFGSEAILYGVHGFFSQEGEHNDNYNFLNLAVNNVTYEGKYTRKQNRQTNN